jgi:hypothetical protein
VQSPCGKFLGEKRRNLLKNDMSTIEYPNYNESILITSTQSLP